MTRSTATLAILSTLLWTSSPLAQATPTPESERRVLPVATYTVERVQGLDVTRQYTGMWEPARMSLLGFELGGTLITLSVDEGETVRAGDPLASVDTLRLDARRAEIAAAQAEARAARELAKLTFDRTAEAAARGAVSPQRRDEAAQDLALREATFERTTRQLETVDADLAKATLLAPFDGIVTRRWVDEGAVVGAGAPIVTLEETDQWELRVGLSGRRASGLSVGDRVRIRQDGQTRSGTIQRLVPTRDPATRTVDVIVTPAQAPVDVRTGDLAMAEFTFTRAEAGVWLPLTALTADTRGLWAAYVPRPTDVPGEFTLERRSLDVRHLDGERVFVAGNLQSGERVVADGLHRVVTGQRVRLLPDRLDPDRLAQR